MTPAEIAALMNSGELAGVIQSLVAAELEARGPAGPVQRVPNRVPLYHAKHRDEAGQPLRPPTPDGKVWRIDVKEWCADGDWLPAPPVKPSPAAAPTPLKEEKAEDPAPPPARRGRTPKSAGK